MSFPFLGERLAVDLLNTLIAEDGRPRDLLDAPGDAAAWGEAAGILAPGAGSGSAAGWPGEPGRLRAFREALRRGLLAWAATGIPDPELLVLLDRHLAADPRVDEIAGRGGDAVLRPRSVAGPRERLYGAVARSAAELVIDGEPGRLRKCADPACRLMFYDVSRGGRRRWCAMEGCGGRAKARAHYRRHRGDGGSGRGP